MFYKSFELCKWQKCDYVVIYLKFKRKKFKRKIFYLTFKLCEWQKCGYVVTYLNFKRKNLKRKIFDKTFELCKWQKFEYVGTYLKFKRKEKLLCRKKFYYDSYRSCNKFSDSLNYVGKCHLPVRSNFSPPTISNKMGLDIVFCTFGIFYPKII